MTKINLELAWREDWAEFIAKDTLASQRMAERIAHDELSLEETPPPPIPKYVPNPKVKLSASQILMNGYKYIAP